MNKLTEAEFLDFYSKAYGEKTDKLGQIIFHSFLSGEELFEFVNDAIEYSSKSKPSGYDKEIKHDFDSYYCKLPILVDVIRVPESPPNVDTPTVNNQDYFGKHCKSFKNKLYDFGISVSSFFIK